jgi:hypothetical protein
VETEGASGEFAAVVSRQNPELVLTEPAVTGCRLLLFAGAGVSDGNACFPKRMRVSPPRPEADLQIVPSGRLAALTEALASTRKGERAVARSGRSM